MRIFVKDELNVLHFSREILSHLRSTYSSTALLSFFLVASSSLADQALLIPAKICGKKSAIYEKVVVSSVKAQLRPTPGGEGTFIEPFSIFYRLRTDDGQVESNGHWRVGTSKGEALGWIKREDVVSWNTRFVLEPLEPTPDRTFTVNLVEGSVARLQIVPAGKRRLAFVTGAPTASSSGSVTDNYYPVVVCTEEVRPVGKRSMTDEIGDLKDLKLEIVFVFESTDFLLTECNGYNLKDLAVVLAKELATAVESEPQLARAGIVRFGAVEYQDSSKKAEFAARVSLPLTGEMPRFISAVQRLRATAIGGDWPEDVLAGLETARTKAGWSANSVKHIIHIGQASMQLDPRGKGVNQCGGNWNLITALWERSNPEADCGWNSTGLTIERLLQLANPEGGAIDEVARNRISFSSLIIQRPVEQELRNKIPNIQNPAELIEMGRSAIQYNDDKVMLVVDAVAKRLSISEDDAVKMLVLLMRLGLAQDQQTLAQRQYQQLTSSRGNDGYFRIVPLGSGLIQGAFRDLLQNLKQQISIAAKIHSGEITRREQLALGETTGNFNAQRYYVIVGAAAERLKASPVLTGTAAIRDVEGKPVAQMKILLTREELTRFRSVCEVMAKSYSAMTESRDRKDVSKSLDLFKHEIVNIVAGQEIEKSVPLKSVIADLPLKTTLLDITPTDIAQMAPETFEQWLNKINSSIRRMDDLLANKAEWTGLSDKAENHEFTLIRLSDLP